MLEDPLFKSHISRKVHQNHRNPSPKLVSVAIHFISSNQRYEQLSVSDEPAALKIQRVFRGFLVRKSVKKISAIGNEVREVERSINDTETVELILVDAKQRLRVNETLMSLLFKLHSIRGVDFGVRDFRKAVINKAIALQEKVDSIRSGEIDSEVVDDSVMNADDVIDATMKVDYALENTETDDKKRNIGFLEKLMDDNEKMMRLMTRMFERNEMQTRVLDSLSQRVEQLEKVFVCDKPRKKKKKQSA